MVETHLVASLPNFYKWKDPGPRCGIWAVSLVSTASLTVVSRHFVIPRRIESGKLLSVVFLRGRLPAVRIVEKTPLHIFSADFVVLLPQGPVCLLLPRPESRLWLDETTTSS